jgi:formylglycine-generating enzyme required for sulfatase activity
MKQTRFAFIIALLFAAVCAMNEKSTGQAVAVNKQATPAQATGKSSDLKPYLETIAGTRVKFDMVPVSGGKFFLGSPENESERNADEGPQIQPFWMGAMEVTWDEYDIFAFSQDIPKKPAPGATPTASDAVTRPTPPYADESFGYGKGRQPVISVTHHAAMEYCRWLTQKTGKLYRLPTEAEWEYACRAGSKTVYSFGEDAKKLAEYAWFADNSEGTPHPVGKKKPNPLGLYDMHGNVAEWCLDSYAKDFYSTLKSGIVEPVLVPTEKRYPNSVRGGSWDDDAQRLRSAARQSSKREWSKRDPQRPQSIWWHTDALTVGFRVVHPLDEQEILKGLKSKVTRQSPDQ